MMVVSLGLLVVGGRSFLAHGITPSPAWDGVSSGSPAVYVAPWAMAVVLVAAAAYLLRPPRDRVF